jgi:hypothetical protein
VAATGLLGFSMTRDEIGNLFDAGCARSLVGLLFQELVAERRRIDTLTAQARDRNPDDPRVARAEACRTIADDRLYVWLSRWEPAGLTFLASGRTAF